MKSKLVTALIAAIVMIGVVSMPSASAQETDQTCHIEPVDSTPIGCRLFIPSSGTYPGTIEALEFRVGFENSVEDADELLTGVPEMFELINAATVDETEHDFGDDYVLVSWKDADDPKIADDILFFRIQNLYFVWTAENVTFDASDLFTEIYENMNFPEVMSASDFGDPSVAVMPDIEDLPEGFELHDEQFAHFPDSAMPGKNDDSSRADAESTASSGIHSSTDPQTIEVMNNLERYQNTQVTLRGKVYIIDKVNDQTVFVITDEETYLFTVVYDGALPDIQRGDNVVVKGLLLDRTLDGSPLVQATSVRED